MKSLLAVLIPLLGSFSSTTPELQIINSQPPEVIEKAVIALSIHELFMKYFPDNWEIMERIAYCESGFRQYDKNGKTIESPTKDYGLLQINRKVWGKKAIELGLDVHSTEDNIKMARHIYDVQGIEAWDMSRHCWGR